MNKTRIILNCNHLGEPRRLALKKQSIKGYFSVVRYTLAIPAAFIQPAVSCLLFGLVSFMWIIPDKNIEGAVKEIGHE